MFKKVAVFGLGLLGGSLCKGIKKLHPETDITAYGRNAEKLKAPLADKTVDRIDTMDRAVLRDVDFIIVSTPVVSSLEIIRNVLNDPALGREAIVIDVGSVKEAVLREAENHPRAGQFIGCHPMAGSEKSGYEHSRPDLYDRASVLITPGRFNRTGDVERLKSFWESLGAMVSVTSASLHDLLVGYTSHLPHVIACALVDLVQGRSESGIRDFIGNGFRDVTRISSGSENMWSDIVRLNRENIGAGIDEFVKKLLELKKTLAEGGDEQIRGYFEKVRRDRGDII